MTRIEKIERALIWLLIVEVVVVLGLRFLLSKNVYDNVFLMLLYGSFFGVVLFYHINQWSEAKLVGYVVPLADKRRTAADLMNGFNLGEMKKNECIYFYSSICMGFFGTCVCASGAALVFFSQL